MEYIQRSIESKFIRMSEFFKAVLITGARLVGKTTMLKHLAEGISLEMYIVTDVVILNIFALSDKTVAIKIIPNNVAMPAIT